ncbi:MAG: hypothetical protein K2L73_05150 [Muribaculaceae bacterium]|nr:hypothetical protein [Muribaculaceae bacterium]
MFRIIFTVMTVCVLWSCAVDGRHSETAGSGNSVPRRHAYHRIPLPDSTFTEIAVGPTGLNISVNTAATCSIRADESGRSRFVDITYPDINSIIYMTVTPVDHSTINSVIDNRLDRIALNLSGADPELIDFDTPAGFENKLIVTHAGISTPVQFLSTDGKSLVVSGVAFIKDATPATVDSLAPIADILQRDITHTLKTMHR